MAVHLTLGYQLACKIVNLRKVGQDERERVESSYTFRNAMFKHGAGPQTIRAMAKASVEAVKHGVTEFSDKRLREINILKDLSHVRRENPAAINANVLRSRTSFDWRRFTIRTIPCKVKAQQCTTS